MTKTETEEAEAAFAIHAALVQREKKIPALKKNARWVMARQEAYERLHSRMAR